ncbi:Hypothetical small peptide [Latilactobacillus sakei subsp. sakei 23K]|uniref:Hypothetical small peptide n=1 Tax=Latilactobacillus sakei subsp. sakei (strain 23K) TaxID=314315 RepID=Q38UU3_LATSS|nr:Hypothetical small peptide [Latilactobacillus sakei subsp. sakei 23K]
MEQAKLMQVVFTALQFQPKTLV